MEGEEGWRDGGRGGEGWRRGKEDGGRGAGREGHYVGRRIAQLISL